MKELDQLQEKAANKGSLILKVFGVDLEKARSGVYADTVENRKKGRVGQKYGNKKEEKQSFNKKTILKKIYSIKNPIAPSELPSRKELSDEELSQLVIEGYLNQYYSRGHGNYYRTTKKGRDFLNETQIK